MPDSTTDIREDIVQILTKLVARSDGLPVDNLPVGVSKDLGEAIKAREQAT